MTALVLAGHGSHISPQTAGIVWDCVDQLRAWGVAEEVTACFWKEMPAFSQVLKTVLSDHIVIVPMFTAQGYFSKHVIPAEMGLEGAITRQSGRTIYYTPTLGEHPFVATIVRQRIASALHHAKLSPQEATIALIGHGTRRDPHSRNATRHQAALLRRENPNMQVLDVYLEDDPNIPSIYSAAQNSAIIAVPFFLAMGSHVTRDVPAALGIEYGQFPARVDGHTLYYTFPVGTTDSLARLALELARGTGLPLVENPPENVWSNFPRAGADRLAAEVRANGRLQLGQVLITHTADSFSVAPVDEPLRTRHCVAAPIIEIETPVQLRARVRENPFRPLATRRDLPQGWRVKVSQPEHLPAVIETIYPGVLADWAHPLDSPFAVEPLHAIGERHRGMFAGIHRALTPAQMDRAVQEVCSNCIRHPTWYTNKTPRDAIPCGAACNMWLSTVRKMKATESSEAMS